MARKPGEVNPPITGVWGAFPAAKKLELLRERADRGEMEPFFPLAAAVYACHLLYSYLAEKALSGPGEARMPFWANLLVEGLTNLMVVSLAAMAKSLWVAGMRERRGGRDSEGRESSEAQSDRRRGRSGEDVAPGGKGAAQQGEALSGSLHRKTGQSGGSTKWHEAAGAGGSGPAGLGSAKGGDEGDASGVCGAKGANGASGGTCPTSSDVPEEAGSLAADVSDEPDGMSSMPSSTSLITELGLTPSAVFPKVRVPAAGEAPKVPISAVRDASSRDSRSSRSSHSSQSGATAPDARWRSYLTLASGSFLISLGKLLCELSLSYVSYPLYQIFKVSKALGILVVSLLTGNTRRLTPTLIWTVALTVGGSVCYSLGEMVGRGQSFAFGRSSGESPPSSSGFDYSVLPGVALLLGYQVSAGFSGSFQDRALDELSRWGPVNTNAIQLFNGASTVAMSLGLGAVTGFPGVAGITLRAVRTQVLVNLLLSLGEIPILLFLRRYGSLQTTLLTTVRKILTILLSIVLFHHKVGGLSLLGIALTVAGILVSALGKYFGRGKISALVRRRRRRGERK